MFKMPKILENIMQPTGHHMCLSKLSPSTTLLPDASFHAGILIILSPYFSSSFPLIPHLYIYMDLTVMGSSAGIFWS